MLEKELAQAVKLAQRANKEVSKLQANLLKETEKAVNRGKRELASARKKQSAPVSGTFGRVSGRSFNRSTCWELFVDQRGH